MSQAVIRQRLYTRTPEAQRLRGEWLEPDQIRAKMARWQADFDGYGPHVAAVGLIEVAQMLEEPDAKFAARVRSILAVLEEFAETAGTRPAH